MRTPTLTRNSRRFRTRKRKGSPAFQSEEAQAQNPFGEKLYPPWKAKPQAPGPGELQGKKASGWEMVVAAELDRRGVSYEFQVSVRGGRTLIGGLVVDFVVNCRPPVIIRVQGTYWHRGAENESRDAQQLFILRLVYPGAEIVDIGQEEILNPDLLKRMLEIVGYG